MALLSASCTRGPQASHRRGSVPVLPGVAELAEVWLQWGLLVSMGWAGEVVGNALLAVLPAALLALPPRADSAGSLFILVSASTVEKPPLAVSHWCILILCFPPVFLSFG